MALRTVYVTRTIPDDTRRLLESVGAVVNWIGRSPIPRHELLGNLHEADALLCTGDDHIDREVLAAAPRLRVIAVAATRLYRIDLRAARERDITVCYAPNAADDAVADMTMALLLACARHISDADHFVKRHEGATWTMELTAGEDMLGSALGIIGLDGIGLQVAHRALGFGMRVLYYDTRRHHDAEQALGVMYGALDDLLREADFVTLHWRQSCGVPLIGERHLRLMKPSAHLINTADPGLIDRHALIRALREGWIAGAALDVDDEILAPDDPLRELANIVLTPGLADTTPDALSAMTLVATRQIIDVLRGGRPAYPAPCDEDEARDHRAA